MLLYFVNYVPGTLSMYCQQIRTCILSRGHALLWVGCLLEIINLSKLNSNKDIVATFPQLCGLQFSKTKRPRAEKRTFHIEDTRAGAKNVSVKVWKMQLRPWKCVSFVVHLQQEDCRTVGQP